MKNILLVYNNVKWTAGIFVGRALANECNVITFNLGVTPYWTNLYGMLPVYIPKGFPANINSVINRFDIKFDCILEIDASGQYHMLGYNKLTIPRIFWSLDTHELDKIRFNSYFKNDYTQLYSCHNNYKSRLGDTCKWLPVACDPDLHQNLHLEKIYDIVFIGNTNPGIYSERVKLLESLSKKFKIKIFSNVYGEEMVKIYNQAKIVFNRSVRGDLNMRVFEVLSCGSLLLTERLQLEAGLEEIFQDKKHLVLYDNEKDLSEKVDYYLKNDDEREQIALEGYKEVREKHTYEIRAKNMLKTIGVIN